MANGYIPELYKKGGVFYVPVYGPGPDIPLVTTDPGPTVPPFFIGPSNNCESTERRESELLLKLRELIAQNDTGKR